MGRKQGGRDGGRERGGREGEWEKGTEGESEMEGSSKVRER